MLKRYTLLFFAFMLVLTGLFPAKGLAAGFSVTYDNNSFMTDRDWVTDAPPVDSNTYETGSKFTVLFPLAEGVSPKRQLRHNNWYSFVGWNTKKDGTGDMYQAGDQVEMGTAPVTLYAQWRKEPVTPWSFLGGLQLQPEGLVQYRQHALAVDEDGTPYVALLTNDSDELKATVMKYTGTGTSGWEVVGTPRFTDKILYSTSNGPFTNMDKVSLHIIGKTIYLGYYSNAMSPIVYEFKLWKYTDATGWQQMNLGDDEKRQTIFYKKIISYQNDLYILNSDYKYGDPNRKFWVVKYNSSNDTWERVTENLEIKNVTVTDDLGWNYYNRIKMAIDGGTPYLAYIDPDTGFTTVTKYTEGTGWETVGQPGFTWWETAGNPTKIIMDLFVDNGTPYVAMENDSAGLVMKYTGDTTKSPSGWEALGGSRLYDQASTYSPRTDAFTLTKYNGTLIAAYAYFNSIKVAKYNGSSWGYFTDPNIEDRRGSLFPKFALVNGEMYVAYEKQPNPPNGWNMEVHVKKAGVDNSPPTVTTYSPVNGATDAGVEANLVLTFNKNVSTVAGKNIRIKKKSGALVETIAANDITKVTVSDKQVTINPTADLEYLTDYYVEIDQGAFAGYEGIANSTTWSFKTSAKVFTVTFDSQGGSSVPPKTSVADGAVIAAPGEPSKANYLFDGWYKEQAGENAWNFAADKVTSNITLYAKWITPQVIHEFPDHLVAPGAESTTVLKKNGTVWRWGKPGQVGDMSANYTDTADQMESMNEVKSVAAGTDHYAALKKDGTVWTWGGNQYGQLGVPDIPTGPKTIVVQVKDKDGQAFTASAIRAGDMQTMALKEDGTVWGWGNGFYGNLSLSIANGRYLPVQVMDRDGNPFTAVDVVGMGGHNLALKNDGSVWGWGYNTEGQLGVGNYESSNVPVQVKNQDGSEFKAVAIAAGDSHSVALKNDGTVWAWGGNSYGQLGDGTLGPEAKKNVPVQVKKADGSPLKAVAISAGQSFTVAVGMDGTVWAWGKNGYGQLGNLSTTDSSIPVQVLNENGSIFRGAEDIVSGMNHSIAVTNSGKLVAWGLNNFGQLGDGARNLGFRPYAVPVGGGFSVEPVTYTVTFDSQNGSPVAPLTKVAEGSTITAPAEPTRDGYTFGGWYKETAATNAWNFTVDNVTADLTLYAKWLAAGTNPAPGFTPEPAPEPGTKPGTTSVPNITPGAGNHLLVKVSSSIIATPDKGSKAPTGAGVIDPYQKGDNIPGVDPKLNRYIGFYEVDGNNKVVKFKLIVLTAKVIKPEAPVPGFDPIPQPEPGTKPGTTSVPNIIPGAGNHLVVKVSSSIIATPNEGDVAPTGAGVIDPYQKGADIPGVDPNVNRFIGFYEVEDASNKVVKFRLIILNPADSKPEQPEIPVILCPYPGPPQPGKDPGTIKISPLNTEGSNRVVVKVSSQVIATPNEGDAPPTGTGVIDPYHDGDDIPGVDPKVNRYIGYYEVDGNNKVVKFRLIVLNPEDVTPEDPVPGFDPLPEPEPGTQPGTTTFPDLEPQDGTRLVVKVSSSIIATPNKGDKAPTDGVIDPYQKGTNIPGVDPIVNRYIGVYEVNSLGKVVTFTLIILNPEDVKPEDPDVPAPGFTPTPKPEPGTQPGTTTFPDLEPGNGNRLVVKVSSTIIATPNVGDAAPTTDVIDPYQKGTNIPGVDPKVNRYIGIYEVDGSNNVVTFTLIILNPEDVKPDDPEVPAPGFTPTPKPEPGTQPGTTTFPDAEPGAGNRLLVKVSSSIIATPNVGDDAPTTGTIIDPYVEGSDIPGVDAKVNRYIGIYEVDGSSKVVTFTLIVLDAEDVEPEDPEVPAPDFTPAPKPEPGTQPGTTTFPDAEPGAGNRLLVKVSSTIIERPNAGDDAPTTGTIIDPYLEGTDIPGVDAHVNRYIGIYEIDGSNKVVKFRLIVLNPEDVKPEAPEVPAPSFDPIPEPEPGTQPGTTTFPDAEPGAGNRLLVKISSSVIATPNVGDDAPTTGTIIDPYVEGDNIPGVDAKVNRYIGIYEVDGSSKVVKFRLIVLEPEDVKPEVPKVPAPGFDPIPKPEPGEDPSTAKIPNLNPEAGNRLLVKISSSIIATPNVGDDAPTSGTIIDPYVAGTDIPGVDPIVNRYIGIYEVDGDDKVVKFRLIVLNPEDIKENGPAPDPAPVPGFSPIPQPKPGKDPETTQIPNVTPDAVNRLVVKVSSAMIETPFVGDTAPTGTGVIDPYEEGDDIPGVDPKGNRYIGIYEVDQNDKVIRFRLIVLNEEDIKEEDQVPDPVPAPGFTPTPKPEPGTQPGTTTFPDVTTETGDNRLVVKVSSSIIATPNLGDDAPLATEQGVIDPYTAGSDIPGVDPKVNRFIGMYEVDTNNKVVKFRLIVLHPEDVKPEVPKVPVPGFDPIPEPKPGDEPGTTTIPGVTTETGDNRLIVKVSSSIIATPNAGDEAPVDPGIIDPYTAGSNIPGVDPTVNRFIGIYEVDPSNKVVKFRLIVLNPEDVKPEIPKVPAPGFSPIPVPEPGSKPGTAQISTTITPGAGNHLVVKVSASMIDTPYVGDAEPTGAGVINPYAIGDDIPGTDAKINRYIGFYEVDGDGKIVKFRLMILNDADVNPEPPKVPAPGFSPNPAPQPGSKPGTTQIPTDITPGTGNHFVVKVSASMIDTPYMGDTAPTGTGVINPYAKGADIPGVDPKVNRFIGFYEVDTSNKVVKFKLIILNAADVNPDVPKGPAPGFSPNPVPKPGSDPGTTQIPTDITPGAGNHFVVKVSSSVIETPNTGDAAPTGTGVINPYSKGADIPGVDPKINRYIGFYEVDGSNKVVKFKLMILNAGDVKPELPKTPAPGFSPNPVPQPGSDPGTTQISTEITLGAGNHFVVKVASSIIETPNVGDEAPTGTGVISPYQKGANIPGVDPKVNRFIGFYEVDSNNKVVKFRLIILNEGEMKPGLPKTPAPGFTPNPEPTPGTTLGTTKIPTNITPDAGNHFVVKVASAIIETPNVGDTAPTGTGVINPYQLKADIPGTDPKVNRFIGFYEVDSNNKVVKFRLIILNESDITPEVPVDEFDPVPVPQPGSKPGTTVIPGVSAGAGNRLAVKVSSSLIATPNVGDSVPTGAGVIDPYTTGKDIPGVDPITNRYIGLYEVDSNNKVVKFTLITLSSTDVNPAKSTPIDPKNVTTDPATDVVTVKDVLPGTTVKIYDKNRNVIGTGFNPGPGRGTVVITTVPGIELGDTIRLTATEPGKVESDPISKTVTNGGDTPIPSPTSDPIDPQNVGTDPEKDIVTIHDVLPGTKVKVYDKDGKVIGEGYNPGPGRATVVITTVPGIEPGDTIHLTATEEGKLESVPVSKQVIQVDTTSKPVNPKNVTTDPDKDTVTVEDVEPGTTIKIYDKDGKVIGEGTNPGPGRGPVVITTNPGIEPGDAIKITATEPGKKESKPVTVVIPKTNERPQYEVETSWEDDSTILITVTPKPGTTPNLNVAYVVVQGIRGDTPVFVTGASINGKQPKPFKLHLDRAQVGDKLYIVVTSQPEYTRSNVGYSLSAEKVEIVRAGGK